MLTCLYNQEAGLMQRFRNAGNVRPAPSLLLRGAIAQLGERIVRNDEVVGSIPTSSTNINSMK